MHDYLKSWERPLHLLGHGTGGLLSLLYARRHPERVRSLTLLSVGAYPTVDWQAHYYALLRLLPCSRECLLMQMVYLLMGHQSPSVAKQFKKVLDRDLSNSLSPHNLYQGVSLNPGGVSVPMLVCAGQDDLVIDPNLLQGWSTYLKPGDRLWQCPSGRYFFHYFQPELVRETIVNFWHSGEISPQSSSQAELATPNR